MVGVEKWESTAGLRGVETTIAPMDVWSLVNGWSRVGDSEYACFGVRLGEIREPFHTLGAIFWWDLVKKPSHDFSLIGAGADHLMKLRFLPDLADSKHEARP